VFREFEDRLTDLLADRLAAVSGIAVLRTLDGTAQVNTVQVAPRITNVTTDVEFGDDDRDRIGPRSELRLRTTLHVAGDVLLTLRIGARANAAQRRQRLLTALDRVLPALAEGEVRRGHAFELPTDQGFELDGFRLLGFAEPEDASAGMMEVRYRFVGRFWPAGIEQIGDAIRRIPVRVAVLPIMLPQGLVAREGTEIEIPVRLDVRALESRAPGEVTPPFGSGHVHAQLRGASPPGVLIGGIASPTGIGRAYAQSETGVFPVIYRAPATVAGRAEAHIDLSYEREGATRVHLGEVAVEVTA